MKAESLLYLTDLSYPAKGRAYGEEDIYITDLLKEYFDVALCHPQCAERFEDSADLIVFRNTGSVIGYKDVYHAFADRVRQKGLKTFNTFTGKADMRGKQYLLDLSLAGYPVIPTVDSADDLHLLPAAERYVVKPRDGALLLVELEDLNPYLSLLETHEKTRNTIMRDFMDALRDA